MKYILIILFSLLLTSPLFADMHKRRILYMWETSSGVQWKGFGNKNTQPQYNGEVLIGKPNGLGVIIFPNGIRYVGEWRYGKYEGQGTYTYGKGEWYGDKYKGEFRGGYRNGQGKYTWSDGDKYVGDFRSDKPNGHGRYTWSDGRVYEGQFKNGKKHGRGTFTSIKGYKYVGEWRRDKPWNVKFYDKNGKIIGKFVNGMKIIEEPVVVVEKKPVVVVEKIPAVVAEKISSVVVDKKLGLVVDKKLGVVVDKKPFSFLYTSGVEVEKIPAVVVKKIPAVVVWKKPVVVPKKIPAEAVEKRQTGVLFHRWENQQWGWFRNGDKKKDLKYVGGIKNGGPNGQGTLTSPNGDKFVGQWRDGKSWNGKSYHKNGTFILKVVNGKIVVN